MDCELRIAQQIPKNDNLIEQGIQFFNVSFFLATLLSALDMLHALLFNLIISYRTKAGEEEISAIVAVWCAFCSRPKAATIFFIIVKLRVQSQQQQ